jgi:hypothetical protein
MLDLIKISNLSVENCPTNKDLNARENKNILRILHGGAKI